MKSSDLKIIIFNSPYYSMANNDFAQLMFGKIINSRIQTYYTYHGEGVFPLGVEDFISDHIIVSHVKENIFEPIASIKMVEKTVCDFFGQRLPIESWLSHKVNNSSIYESVNTFLNKNDGICYTGSYSCIKINSEIDSLVHKLIAIGIYKLMQSKLCKHNFAAGLKTGQRFMNYVGWELFDERTVTIPDIKNQKGFVYKLTNFSEKLLQDYNKYIDFWEKRIEISAPKSHARDGVLAA